MVAKNRTVTILRHVLQLSHTVESQETKELGGLKPVNGGELQETAPENDDYYICVWQYAVTWLEEN